MRANEYTGERLPIGEVVVLADGAPLPTYSGIFNHSPDGFEWGYAGSGPAQLALAIVCDALGVHPRAKAGHFLADQPAPIERALKVYQSFKFRTVAKFDSVWRMSRAEALAVIDAIDPPAAEATA